MVSFWIENSINHHTIHKNVSKDASFFSIGIKENYADKKLEIEKQSIEVPVVLIALFFYFGLDYIWKIDLGSISNMKNTHILLAAFTLVSENGWKKNPLIY